jgi:hypothetical protein
MLAFLQNSVTNHTSYVKISDDTSLKHFYVIQFEGLKGRSSDIAIQLQQIAEFNYKHTNISTSLSKDGEYRKINGVILKIKKMFETDKLALQNDVFLSGYSLEEAFIKNATNWDDIDEKETGKEKQERKKKQETMRQNRHLFFLLHYFIFMEKEIITRLHAICFPCSNSSSTNIPFWISS